MTGVSTATLLGLVLVAAPPLAGPALAADIVSPGPLTSIAISSRVNCQVTRTGPVHPVWYSEPACGTFVSANGVLFGGTIFGPTISTLFTPVSDSLAGAGTVGDPFRSTVVVDLPGVSLRLTQVDTYVTGQESYSTTVTVANRSSDAATGILYTLGDCYVDDSDEGYGRLAGAAAVCAASQSSGTPINALVPITAGNHWQEGHVDGVFQRVVDQEHFADTCDCDTFDDNAAGLSWPLSVPGDGSVTFQWQSMFPDLGALPIQLSATADDDTSILGAANGYTVFACNYNPEGSQTLSSLIVTLPPSFTYVPAPTDAAVTLYRLSDKPGVVRKQKVASIKPALRKPGASAKVPSTAANATRTLTRRTFAEKAQTKLRTTKVGTVRAGKAPKPAASRLSAAANSPRISNGGNTINWVGSLPIPAEQCASLHFAVTVGSTAGTFTISAVGTAVEFDVVGFTQAAAIVVRPVVDVSVDVAFDPATVDRGDPSTLTTVVKNAGPSTATGAVLRVTLASPLRWDSTATLPAGCTRSGQVVTCALADIPAGDPEYDFRVATTVAPQSVTQRRYSATGVVTVADDSDPGNNTDTAYLTIRGELPITGGGDPAISVALAGVGFMLTGGLLLTLARRRTWR